jgi:hypothetical protein
MPTLAKSASSPPVVAGRNAVEEVNKGLRSIPSTLHKCAHQLNGEPELAIPDSLVVRGIIASAADTSTFGAVSKMCSPTSCARNSYETDLRSRGSISICSRKMRILHIAMNEHGLISSLHISATHKEYEQVQRTHPL